MPTIMSRRLFQVARLLIIATPVVVFLWLANEYFAFSGKLSLTQDFRSVDRFASTFYPADRVEERSRNVRTGTVSQKITGDPVYLDVRVPRSFDAVDVTVEYINNGQPFAEFGLLTYIEPFGITLLPFESELLEQAQSSFQTLTGVDPRTGKPAVIYQRDRIVASVEEFFRQPPTDKRIITYGVDVPLVYRDPLYAPRPDNWTLPMKLRGQHSAALYIKDEPLIVDAEIIDLNRELGPDTLTTVVKNEQGGELWRDVVADDENTGTDRKQSSPAVVHIQLEQLPEGPYTISFFTTHDIVFTNITTRQQKFVIKDSVTTISDDELRDDSNDTIGTSSTTALLGMQGFFASAPEHFFDPAMGVRKLSDQATLDDVDIIVTQEFSLPRAKLNRDIRTQTVHIDLTQTSIDRKKLTFVLSSPGITARHARFEIRKIHFAFTREPLWKRILARLQKM